MSMVLNTTYIFLIILVIFSYYLVKQVVKYLINNKYHQPLIYWVTCLFVFFILFSGFIIVEPTEFNAGNLLLLTKSSIEIFILFGISLMFILFIKVIIEKLKKRKVKA